MFSIGILLANPEFSHEEARAANHEAYQGDNWITLCTTLCPLWFWSWVCSTLSDLQYCRGLKIRIPPTGGPWRLITQPTFLLQPGW